MLGHVRHSAELRTGPRDGTAEPALTGPTGGVEVWATLDAHERNTLLGGLLRAVIVARAGGRGARTTLADRVRVLANDTELELLGRDGAPELALESARSRSWTSPPQACCRCRWARMACSTAAA
jgi:hypothetical protein